jgi:hypothetical protein
VFVHQLLLGTYHAQYSHVDWFVDHSCSNSDLLVLLFDLGTDSNHHRYLTAEKRWHLHTIQVESCFRVDLFEDGGDNLGVDLTMIVLVISHGLGQQ